MKNMTLTCWHSGGRTRAFIEGRLEEAKDSSTVQVLDIATVPEKAVKPQKGLIVISATILAGLLGFFVVFFLESLENAKMNAKNREMGDKPKVDFIQKRWRG